MGHKPFLPSERPSCLLTSSAKAADISGFKLLAFVQKSVANNEVLLLKAGHLD